MDDKTSLSLQPSTTFDDSSSSTTDSLPRPLPLISSPTYQSTTFNTFLPLPAINLPFNMERQDKFDVRNTMLSPPEQTPQDSFSRSASGPSREFNKMKSIQLLAGRGQAPLSPPISPESRNINPEDPLTIVVRERDPVLFPREDALSTSSSQPPLFTDTDTHRLVDEHVATRESSRFREVSPPRHNEYELALEFKSRVYDAFNADRRLWQRRELAQLRDEKLLNSGGRRYTAIAPATSGARIRKEGPRASTAGGIKKSPPKIRPVKVQTFRGTTPDAAKRVAREDKDFSSLPDYCPPINSLPNKPNSLKVDWKGAPIDLKYDPHAHLLHPDEVSLAANLRLDCATYLTSKRRIFIKRIEAYKIGKEFRKTDAQQACKIDVNKASKLWAAFDKVGWLKQHWIEKYV
jgi:hypothetical protein